ncbi:isoprenylcysteine carboxylmethyltransferase family protein [Patescibacteria group bacterium]|nr:isoprenylcysteine carboxylmethyltransferase family protein [Patescibacteria group bacterium]
MPKPSSVSNKTYALLVARGIFKTIMTGVIIFWIAGTWDYWQGWVLFGYFIVVTIFLIFLFNARRELMMERVKPGKGVKLWDRIVMMIFGLLMLAMLIVGVLDAARFHWSPALPVYVYVVSYIVLTASMLLVLWAMLANNYFATYVRIQEDRGHQVCTSGPYKYVRHPGYSGIIPAQICFAFILGSYWALIPAGAILLLFILRTELEDRTLQKELEGYKEYASKVRSRLIPSVW